MVCAPWTAAPGAAWDHWRFYLEPIESVKKGYFLLDAVPSQYGFLSILLPAALPLSSLCAFFLCIVLSQIAWAMLFYHQLAGSDSSTVFRFTSMAIIFVAVCVVPGWAPDLTGPLPFPSVSAYRFLPVIVYWALAFEKRLIRGAFFARGVSAAVAALWSFEALCLVGVLETVQTVLFPEERSPLFVRIARLAGKVLAVGVPFLLVYSLWLGHFPDLYAFGEFGLMYARGFGALLIDFRGNLHWMLGCYILLVCVSALLWSQWPHSVEARQAISVTALIGAMSFYFVTRSHESNATNLLPYFLFSLAVHQRVLDARPQTRSIGRWVRVVFFCLSTAMLISVFSETGKIRVVFGKWMQRPWTSLEERVGGLLPLAGVDGDPRNGQAIRLLSTDRRREYLERTSNR
jgi:hypothetical protein